MDRLEVLGLPRCGGHADLFLAKESVDGARLADIRVPHKADNKLRRYRSRCVTER